MTHTEKNELASRFGLEDWQRLCSDGKFYFALRHGTYEEAEVIAETLLAKWNGLN